jgi:hypothetical protein
MVSRAEFNLLWDTADMPAKIVAGVFTEDTKESAATNPRYRGGRSVIVKLISRGEHHIGTIHRIVMPDGSIPHEHPKDYTLRDCSRVRIEEPRG